MKAFFFDTETTWLQDYDQIVQFWWIFWNYNPETNVFIEERRINQYLNVHAEISPKAYETHHLSKEFLSDYWYIDEYIDEILSYFELADIVIAHNAEFDRRMVVNECKRLGRNFDTDDCFWIDTMKPTTSLVKARFPGWGKWFKYPKLTELYYFLFNRNFEDAHNAIWDVLATKECFLELQKSNYFDLPVNIWKSKWIQEELIKVEENKNVKVEEKPKKKWIIKNDELVNDEGIIYYWTTKDGIPHWEGKLYSESENLIYEWSFLNGKVNWRGKAYYKNWNIRYEWNFKNWKFEGKGNLYYSNWELKYKWEFKNWQYSWEGEFYEDNTLIYKGWFKNGFYDWKWEEYRNWKLIYTWDFQLWFYDWKGKLLNEKWILIYSWWFKEWEYHGKWLEYGNWWEFLHGGNFYEWKLISYDNELDDDSKLSVKQLKEKYPLYPREFLRYYKKKISNFSEGEELIYEDIESCRDDTQWEFEDEEDNKIGSKGVTEFLYEYDDEDDNTFKVNEEKSLDERIGEFDNYKYDDENEKVLEENIINYGNEEIEDDDNSEYVDPIDWIPESLKKKKKDSKITEKKNQSKKEKIKKEIKSSIKEKEKRKGFFNKKENIYAVTFIIGVAIIITIIEIILL